METTHKVERNNGCVICQMWLDSDKNWNPDTKNEPKVEVKLHKIQSASIPADSSVAEVYAANIMSSQLKEMKIKDIESERQHFLRFLKERWNLGWRWENQLVAWEDYKNVVDYDDFTDDELEVSWMNEIDEIINQSVRVGNYSEFGGQQ